MKIYTKTGDKGETSLYSGGRVAKSHPRLGLLGTLDELNAQLGLALVNWPNESELQALRLELKSIQNRIFDAGAQFACDNEDAWEKLPRLIHQSDIDSLEQSIDSMDSVLPPLTNFILPGASIPAGFLHLARATCRRAEREAVALTNQNGGTALMIFLNRLSDFLFVAARFVNYQLGENEAEWDKG